MFNKTPIPSKFEIKNKKFQKGDRFQINAAVSLYKPTGHFFKEPDGSMTNHETEVEVFPQVAVEFHRHPIPKRELDKAIDDLALVLKQQCIKAGIVGND